MGSDYDRPLDRSFSMTAVRSADELADRPWKSIPNLYDIKLGIGALVLIWGPPGAGKSTMLLRWLNSMPGPVLYASLEERFSPSFRIKLSQAGVSRKDFKILSCSSASDLVGVIIGQRPRYFAIDSLSGTSIKSGDLRRIQLNRLDALFGILHATKAGLPAGSNDFLHEADVVVSLESFKYTVDKSRYGDVGKGGQVYAVDNRCPDKKNSRAEGQLLVLPIGEHRPPAT